MKLTKLFLIIIILILLSSFVYADATPFTKLKNLRPKTLTVVGGYECSETCDICGRADGYKFTKDNSWELRNNQRVCFQCLDRNLAVQLFSWNLNQPPYWKALGEEKCLAGVNKVCWENLNPEDTYELYVWECKQKVTCGDTDGKDAFEKSQFTYQGVTYKERCLSETKLLEYYCQSHLFSLPTVESKSYNCQDFYDSAGRCVNGICIYDVDQDNLEDEQTVTPPTSYSDNEELNCVKTCEDIGYNFEGIENDQCVCTKKGSYAWLLIPAIVILILIGGLRWLRK